MNNLIENHIECMMKDKEALSELLFELNAPEREAFEAFIDDYVETVKSKKNLIEKEDAAIVIVGCEVELEDVEDGESMSIKVISPSTEEDEDLLSHASYLSSLGKALLFKTVGDVVTVKVPVGNIQYKVKKITLCA